MGRDHEGPFIVAHQLGRRYAQRGNEVAFTLIDDGRAVAIPEEAAAAAEPIPGRAGGFALVRIPAESLEDAVPLTLDEVVRLRRD